MQTKVKLYSIVLLSSIGFLSIIIFYIRLLSLTKLSEFLKSNMVRAGLNKTKYSSMNQIKFVEDSL